MYVVLELTRRLTNRETKAIFDTIGYYVDEEVEEIDGFLQFVGQSDDDDGDDFDAAMKEAESIYSDLVGMSLPATDIFIDDGSQMGFRPNYAT